MTDEAMPATEPMTTLMEPTAPKRRGRPPGSGKTQSAAADGAGPDDFLAQTRADIAEQIEQAKATVEQKAGEVTEVQRALDGLSAELSAAEDQRDHLIAAHQAISEKNLADISEATIVAFRKRRTAA